MCFSGLILGLEDSGFVLGLGHGCHQAWYKSGVFYCFFMFLAHLHHQRAGLQLIRHQITEHCHRSPRARLQSIISCVVAQTQSSESSAKCQSRRHFTAPADHAALASVAAAWKRTWEGPSSQGHSWWTGRITFCWAVRLYHLLQSKSVKAWTWFGPWTSILTPPGRVAEVSHQVSAYRMRPSSTAATASACLYSL